MKKPKTPKTAKTPKIRNGSKYAFGTIPLGGERFYDTDKPINVQNSAYRFAQTHGRRFEAEPAEGGVYIKRPRPRPRKKAD